ncbi:MAG: tetratricopeptide repeat protein [Terrimicrobiaceae bacterium]
MLKRRISVLSALAGVFAAAIFFSLIAWNLGIGEGKHRVFAEQTKEKVSVSKEFLAEVDQALADLRTGDAEKALKKLQELESSKSQVASLTYMLALAAMQNGDITLAEKKATESIAKRERVSDSLALQAVLETQKRADSSMKTFGDTRLRSELLLRQAILADAANPFPLIELATLLRYQKRNEEALALLRAARSRLNPVDSHAVIDVTINLATLGDTSDAMLPDIAEPGKDLAAALGAAYVAMRKGNFDKASEILKIARAQTPPDLFDYLINDPTIRRYASEPKLREFFQ